MHTPVRTLALVSLLFGCLVAGALGRSPHRVGTPGSLPVSAVSQLPLSFEPNRGQAPSNDSWLARSAGIQVGFSRSSFSLLLPSTMFPQNISTSAESPSPPIFPSPPVLSMQARPAIPTTTYSLPSSSPQGFSPTALSSVRPVGHRSAARLSASGWTPPATPISQEQSAQTAVLVPQFPGPSLRAPISRQ